MSKPLRDGATVWGMLRSRLMLWFGGAILAFVALWSGFRALDTFGLPYHTAQGVVVGKHHRPMSKSFVRSGNTTHASITPEAWLAQIEVDGRIGWWAIDAWRFGKLAEGDSVWAEYGKHRITSGVRFYKVVGFKGE
jgi:hypothetical protein